MEREDGYWRQTDCVPGHKASKRAQESMEGSAMALQLQVLLITISCTALLQTRISLAIRASDASGE